jgi:hypothetical protein
MAFSFKNPRKIFKKIIKDFGRYSLMAFFVEFSHELFKEIEDIF